MSFDVAERCVRADVIILGRRHIEVGVKTLTVVGVVGCRQMYIAGCRREMNREDRVVDVGSRRAVVRTITVLGYRQRCTTFGTTTPAITQYTLVRLAEHLEYDFRNIGKMSLNVMSGHTHEALADH